MSMSKKEASDKAVEMSKAGRMYECLDTYVKNGVITKEEANTKIRRTMEALSFSFGSIGTLIMSFHDALNACKGKDKQEIREYLSSTLAGIMTAFEMEAMSWSISNPDLSRIYFRGLHEYVAKNYKKPESEKGKENK